MTPSCCKISNEVQCFIDSGASAYMTPRRFLFSDFETIPPLKVFMEDESETEVLGRGNSKLELNV